MFEILLTDELELIREAMEIIGEGAEIMTAEQLLKWGRARRYLERIVYIYCDHIYTKSKGPNGEELSFCDKCGFNKDFFFYRCY